MKSRAKKLIKITWPNETTTYFLGLDEAAKALHITIQSVSHYLNNHVPVPFGLKFEVVTGEEKLLYMLHKQIEDTEKNIQNKL